MIRKISQREARRLYKRVQELEQSNAARLRAWSSEYPGGVNIASCVWSKTDVVPVAIHTARLLGYAVVVTEHDGRVLFYGVKP